MPASAIQPIPSSSPATPVEQPAQLTKGARERIRSIDFARGLVMIIMALDHTRDLFHDVSITQSPTDLATTTPVLFFTRWITHLCAPTFVFLAGTSAYLSSRLTGSVKESRKFLLSRGLVLLLLEFTIVNFGISFDLHFRLLIFQVIGAIGLGMILLSLSLKLSARTIGLIGLFIIIGHDALIYVNSPLKNILSPLYAPGIFPITPRSSLMIAYPPVPWLGMMFAGFGAGALLVRPAANRKKLFVTAGCILLSLFIILRAINFYGDPSPWSSQKNGLFTFLSFINTSKYPPSLLYALMTLGISFFILAWAEGRSNKLIDVVSVYGKVPMFYYLIHWYILHLLMLALMFVQGYHWHNLDFSAFRFGRPQGKSGLPLEGVYLVWMVVVTSLYPLCKWYGNYKASHRDNKLLRYI